MEVDLRLNQIEYKYEYAEDSEEYKKGRYGIVDTRDGRAVVTSNSWFIVDELYQNGYNFNHTPYRAKRLY
jgi:hypothetical protein